MCVCVGGGGGGGDGGGSFWGDDRAGDRPKRLRGERVYVLVSGEEGGMPTLVGPRPHIFHIAVLSCFTRPI